MCTFFPVGDFLLMDAISSFLPMEARNCPPTVTDGNDNNSYASSSICYEFETDNRSGYGSGKVDFLDDTITGYMCVGSTYNEKESNEPPLYVMEEDFWLVVVVLRMMPIRVQGYKIGCSLTQFCWALPIR